MQIIPKTEFHNDDVTNGVTAWRQIQPSILMFQWNCHVFHDDSKTIWEMMTKVYLMVYHRFLIMLIVDTEYDINDDINMPNIYIYIYI